MVYVSYGKLSKKLKNSIKIKVGEAVLELLIQKQHFGWFDLYRILTYLDFNAILEFLEHFFYKMHICYFSKKC